MNRASLASVLAPATRHQLTSSLGLAVLYGANFVALTGGLVTPLAMVAACVPALLAGAFIARLKTWPAMGLATIVGTLGCLAIGGRDGVPGTILFGALMLQLVVSVVVSLRHRWHWLCAVASLGAFALLNVWHGSAILPVALVLVGLAGAWLTGAFTALVQKSVGHDRASSWMTAATAIVATLSTIAVCGFSSRLVAVLGILIAVQGMVHDQAPGNASPTGKLLVGLGLGLGVVAAWLWVGILGLVIGLGLWSVFLAHIDKNQNTAKLVQTICAVTGVQGLALALGHPSISGATGPMWHLWSLVAVGFSLQLVWMVRNLRIGGQLPSWTHQAVMSMQAIVVLAAASTEISMATSWPPALTLLWTGAAALLWLIGAPKFRVAAVVVLAAAVLKLLAFDWMLLGIGTRVSLLLAVGTTMFVTPLVGAIETVSDVEATNEEIELC